MVMRKFLTGLVLIPVGLILIVFAVANRDDFGRTALAGDTCGGFQRS